ERVAEILNQNFVSIKVDREERPDIDQIYMAALQAMTGGGGWPMSLFLTPEGQPFFAGTYFPPRFSHGTHSFTDVLTSVIDAWQYRREELQRGGEQIVAALLAHEEELEGATAEIGQEILARAYEAILRDFDAARGGWGEGPKFPQPMVLEFLLRHHLATGLSEPLEMATQTLDAMARGGIYDQLGGGFHRYSVDGNWLVPHFEKMLYDNAQLARVYLHGWQLTNALPVATGEAPEVDLVARCRKSDGVRKMQGYRAVRYHTDCRCRSGYPTGDVGADPAYPRRGVGTGLRARPRNAVRRSGFRGGGPVGKVLDRESLIQKVAALKAAGKKIVFTNGCFDLIHTGHVRYLREAASFGDILVVGLNSDASIRLFKDPGRPLVPEADRAEVLAALEMVDYVSIFEERTSEALVAVVRPDIYVKGGDYRSEDLPEARIVDSYGGRVQLVGYVEGRSTSQIVRDILESYCPKQ
ncbi:MAG TPA: D-glycero-beta-D-manno-heptose 1-phosphate adenylyltransferase, partial [Chloroflexota bacterium]|nr:D-glycero-beta-D-manno-heptose 1-phosphate adenylyltransferase [Chloroflexota bacterium]